MNLLAGFNQVYGYIIVVVIIIAICLLCWFVRKRLKIGTYTKEEKKMKSNLELLLKEEEKEEGKDYTDEV